MWTGFRSGEVLKPSAPGAVPGAPLPDGARLGGRRDALSALVTAAAEAAGRVLFQYTDLSIVNNLPHSADSLVEIELV